MGMRGNRRTNGSKASFMLLHEYIGLHCREGSSTCELAY